MKIKIPTNLVGTEQPLNTPQTKTVEVKKPIDHYESVNRVSIDEVLRRKELKIARGTKSVTPLPPKCLPLIY